MQLLIENAEQVEELTLHTGLLTDDEFWELCSRYPDWDVEISAEGVATVMAPVNTLTGFRNADLLGQLYVWAKKDKRGMAADSSVTFVLPNGARRSPDACWVANERIRPDDQGAWRLCPDFVIELRSHTDRTGAVRQKMQEWMENGAHLAWLIEPKRRMVTVYRPNREPETLVQPEQVVGEGPVAGFILDTENLWITRPSAA